MIDIWYWYEFVLDVDTDSYQGYAEYYSECAEYYGECAEYYKGSWVLLSWRPCYHNTSKMSRARNKTSQTPQ